MLVNPEKLKLPEQNQEDNPKGHTTLNLEYRDDGKLYTKEGVRFIADFPIGPEQHHVDLFLKYERTFGRGKANYYTHTPMNMDQVFKFEKKIGQGFRNAYRALAKKLLPSSHRALRNRQKRLLGNCEHIEKSIPNYMRMLSKNLKADRHALFQTNKLPAMMPKSVILKVFQNPF